MAQFQPLTIIHTIRAPVGGAFRHVSDLARAQTAAGHAVGIVCDALTGGTFEADRIAALSPALAHGITRIPMRRAISPADMMVTARLLRRIAGLRPDVLHGHGSKGGAYARLIGSALRLSGQTPLRLYCPHGGSLHFDAASRKSRVLFALERFQERLSDGLIFVSDYEATVYAAKVGRPTIPSVVVRNGVAPDEFEPVTADTDATDLLFVGTLRDLKGVDVLIDALAALRRSGRTVTATIVGDGEDEAALKSQSTSLGLDDAIRFLPPMPMRAALRHGRVMVMPSRAESLPYVVLETLAAGMPLIATRVGGIPEVFGGASDALIPPDDAAALAGAIARALDDPAAARTVAAGLRDHVRQRFSVAAMAADIDGFYRQLRRPEGMPAAAPDDVAAHDHLVKAARP